MRLLLITLVWTLCCFSTLAADESGDAVVVVYNSQMPASKDVADHYAAVRHVPTNQVFGVDLPTTETVTRADYHHRLEEPLLAYLQKEKLMVFQPFADTNGVVKVKESSIRYLVLCYGIPLRILDDPSLIEPGEETLQGPVRHNGAAVDTELCLLPWANGRRLLAGPSFSPFYRAGRQGEMDPVNGLLMVSRLDGPSAAIAIALVDKAMEAETNGLWGRAYFDLRGLTNGPFKKGDDWLGLAADLTWRYGFETIVDTNPATFSSSFPMSQIALYAGWYDGSPSGPFAQPTVEFMPGAFAYHLYSFSATTLRSTNSWCGALLAKGVTATIGYVDEPYLDGTIDVGMFFARWLRGFTYGEAAYAAQRVLSWQTTIIGDPLFRPFGRDPKAEHEELLRRDSKLLEWSHLRVINLSINMGTPTSDLVHYLNEQKATRHSAVLMEKLGDLYAKEYETRLAVKAYKTALGLDPTPLQAVRLKAKVKNKGPQ